VNTQTTRDVELPEGVGRFVVGKMLKSGRLGQPRAYGGFTRGQARGFVRELQRHDTRKAAAAVTREGDSVIVERPRVRQNTPHGRGPRSSGGRRHASPTRGSPDRPSEGDGGEDEPPLAACGGCGEPLPPARAGGPGRTRRYHGPNCRKVALRNRERTALEASEELLERARLARHAIREGADPLMALSIVVCPPETADEARALLRKAA
jgi:hypothetical protein